METAQRGGRCCRRLSHRCVRRWCGAAAAVGVSSARASLGFCCCCCCCPVEVLSSNHPPPTHSPACLCLLLQLLLTYNRFLELCKRQGSAGQSVVQQSVSLPQIMYHLKQFSR